MRVEGGVGDDGDGSARTTRVARRHRGVPRPAAGDAARRRSITLREGGTPLVPAPRLSELTGCEVHLKVEGVNPTGSFKDRGMTVAISKAAEEGAKAVICASTGNTSRQRRRLRRPGRHDLRRAGAQRQDRDGQAGAGARPRRPAAAGRRQLRRLPRRWPATSPTTTRSRWSTRSTRTASRARRRRRSRSATRSATRPTCTACRSATPATSRRTGRATSEYAADGMAGRRPRMRGFQAAGAAPDRPRASRSLAPTTIATAIRIGNPASWQQALARPRRVAAGDRGGHRPRRSCRPTGCWPREEAVFVEPASAASVAGLLQARDERAARRRVRASSAR